jgi:hypothetical protein
LILHDLANSELFQVYKQCSGDYEGVVYA